MAASTNSAGPSQQYGGLSCDLLDANICIMHVKGIFQSSIARACSHEQGHGSGQRLWLQEWPYDYMSFCHLIGNNI